jgi:hypothetical protein
MVWHLDSVDGVNEALEIRAELTARRLAAMRDGAPYEPSVDERLRKLEAEALKCRRLLDDAAIEHSGRTLSERVADLVRRDDKRMSDCINAHGQLNEARAEIERLRQK